MSRLVEMVVSLYSLGLLAYVVLSWVRGVQTDKVRRWLSRFYEPLLAKIRATVKPMQLGSTLLDLSPIILLFGLAVLKGLVLYLLPRGW